LRHNVAVLRHFTGESRLATIEEYCKALNVVPRVLIWARETANLSLEEAAKKLRISARRLASFEAGEQGPTRQQIAAMAKRYYRPLLAFYLASPPREADQPRDFRSLPERPPPGSDALVSALLRVFLLASGWSKLPLRSLRKIRLFPLLALCEWTME
jgi:transcriptional regulator with XRE-family HTH domain